MTPLIQGPAPICRATLRQRTLDDLDGRANIGAQDGKVAVMGKLILIGVLLLPAAEVALFILVAAQIGLPQALGLLLATTAAGLIVLRYAGTTQFERLRLAVTQSGLPGIEAGGNAFLTVSAGILLLLPGFITDAFGILLLLPPVRRWIGARFRQAMQRDQGPHPAGVVDLDREDWTRAPERVLDDPDRKNDRL
jgi:UPF0716 protein FxsA